MTRQDVEADATVALAFDDGVVVPCNAFVVKSTCDVLRDILEVSTGEVSVGEADAGSVGAEPGEVPGFFSRDPGGRRVIPMPGQASGAFRLAMDVVHGVRRAFDTTIGEIETLTGCMKYLGCTAFDFELDARLWHLVQHEDLAVVLRHAPRLLRNPALAAVVCRRLVALRPLWPEFLAGVLGPLEAHADHQVVTAVATYVPNFFAPHLVLAWALIACRALTQDLAFHLASMHAVMYHPVEKVAALRALAALGEARGGWDGRAACMLKNAVTSTEKYDPVPPARLFGTLIKFHDVSMVSVSVCLDHGALPVRPARLAPWLRVYRRGHARVGLSFKPWSIDDFPRRTVTAVQLRATCFDKGEAVCNEAWYEFVLAGHNATYTLEQGALVAGVDFEMDAARVRRARLDFFYGARSVLTNPFDIAPAPKLP